MIQWENNYDNTKVTVELGEAFPTVAELFDFEYPFYTEEHKPVLEQKIFDHYRFRQIGQETPARFKHYFMSRMREIMPYYVQLYQSETIQENVDPFDNYLLEETFERTVTGTRSHDDTTNTTQTNSGELDNTTTSANHGNVDTKIDRVEDKTTKESDTPQGSIENLDNYMSRASVENGSVTDHTETVTADGGTVGFNQTNSDTSTVEAITNTTENDNQTESYRLYKHGNIGVQTFGDELQKYRDVMLNIDVMVINDLNCLFLGVY